MEQIFFKITEPWTELMVSQWNSSGIFSQDSMGCSSVKKSKVYCTDWEKHQKFSQEEFYLCRCSTTFPVEQKTMKKSVWQTPNSYLCMQEDLEQDNGHSLVLVQRKSGTLSKKTVHKKCGTKLQKGCCWNSLRADVQFSVLEEYAFKMNAKYFACRSKAKTKPQRREPAGSLPRIVPIGRRNWIDIEPGKYSFSECKVSKKVTFLLRHSQQMHRQEDGAIHFWRIKENLQNQLPQSIHWSDGRWQAGGGEKRRFQ